VEADSEWEIQYSYLSPGTGDLSSHDRQKKILKFGRKAAYIGQSKIRAKVMLSCVGIFVEPSPWPSNVTGRETFQGEIIHSARWDNHVDFDGKDVVVVGSGCSAVQIVPSLLKEPYKLRSLTQILRTAPWVIPRLQEPSGQEIYAKYAPVVFRISHS
jgi:cation diffusion facilitator CzcD-associated flavoprotein CzcO